jgi:hypothetical protein
LDPLNDARDRSEEPSLREKGLIIVVIKAEICAGVCGFCTTVQANGEGSDVQVKVISGCPRVEALAADLCALDAFQEVLSKSLGETMPALLSAKHRLHAACPVPVGILKAIEAAAGLALPADCSVVLTREE